MQGLPSIDRHTLLRKLGQFPEPQFRSVKKAIRNLLDLYPLSFPQYLLFESCVLRENPPLFPNSVCLPILPDQASSDLLILGLLGPTASND